jgi:hypothetical protein
VLLGALLGDTGPAASLPPGCTDVVARRNGRWVTVSAAPGITVDLLQTALEERLALVGIPG